MKRIRLRLLLTIYNLLLVISPIFAVGTSGIYQHSVALTGYISPETGKAPTAYLWISEGCQQVKAVMLAQQNMTEEMLYKNEMFRERMEVLDVALVWVAPWFSQNWDPTTGCQVIFEEMMVGLAGQSGHRELEYCPVIPFGHSAQATFPWNFAAWNNDRTLCIISFHGDAPRTNLCGYGTANVEWGRTRNIDGIPGLMTFWYFDKEMAELAEARYAETRGKQTREIGEIKTEWSKDGQTLTVTAPKDVRVEVICGPLRKTELRQPMINDQLSMINYEKYPYECGLDNRLLAGYEYTSRANLGLDVPFATWKDLTGKYSNWNVLAEGALGQWRAVFEIAYNHYVGRRHLAMPATSLALGHYVRPEGAGFTCDNPGFGSLLFYQGTEVDAFTAVPTPITYKVNKRRPYNVSTEPVIKLENAPRLSLVRTVDCWPEYWDLLPVRQDGNVYEYEPQGARSRNGYTFAEGEVATTFLVREQAGLPAFVDGGASRPVLPPFSVSPLPEKDGPALSADYHVEIRRAAANADEWTTVPVLRCNVDTRRVQQAAFAEFDMSEPVVVRITSHRPEQAAAVDVRPHSRQLQAERLNDSTVLLRLDRPEYLSVEFGGDRLHNLHVLANAPLTEHHSPAEPKAIDWVAPNSQDVFVEGARLIYFGPGVHKPKDLPSEEIKIPSNCTVYLAPGAVVKARLIVDRAENVRIVGRGIIDHPLRGIEITYSKNVLVDGITILNPAHYTVFGGQSENITIRNIKSFSARSWSDGIDLMCCRHVRVENCFLRTSDDCIALYNHRWWYWGGSEDFDISRCIFWPDVAHPVNIGSHGDDRAPKGELLSGVRIHDCDILYGREQGLLAIQCGDQNTIQDVRFDSIRIEGVQRGRIFDLRVLFSEKYNRAPGELIDDIHFDHITVDADTPDENLMPSRVDDYDPARRVRNFTIGDVRIGSRHFDPERDIVRTMTHDSIFENK